MIDLDPQEVREKIKLGKDRLIFKIGTHLYEIIEYKEDDIDE